jgi:hypothetical protein
MVAMADDSSEENDENEAEEEEQEVEVEANTNDIETVPSADSTGTQNVQSKATVITYGNVQKPSSVTKTVVKATSKSVAKAKATISKITKKVNRVVAIHRQRFSFYRCQTSCLVGAISCMNTCRTKGAYTFYRDQYMVCGRKCRLNQYKCKKVCKSDLSRVRAEQMRRLRS